MSGSELTQLLEFARGDLSRAETPDLRAALASLERSLDVWTLVSSRMVGRPFADVSNLKVVNQELFDAIGRVETELEI